MKTFKVGSLFLLKCLVLCSVKERCRCHRDVPSATSTANRCTFMRIISPAFCTLFNSTASVAFFNYGKLYLGFHYITYHE
jgi:hypothetical protein